MTLKQFWRKLFLKEMTQLTIRGQLLGLPDLQNTRTSEGELKNKERIEVEIQDAGEG